MSYLFQKIITGLLLLCMTVSAVETPKKCRKFEYGPKQQQAIIQSAGKQTTHYTAFNTKQYCIAASVFVIEDHAYENAIATTLVEQDNFVQLIWLSCCIHPPFPPPRLYQLHG